MHTFSRNLAESKGIKNEHDTKNQMIIKNDLDFYIN